MREKIISKALFYVPMTYDENNDIFCVTDYYGYHKRSKVAYCCMFAWDIFRMCDASAYFYGGGKIASCTTLLNYYKKKHPTWVHKDIKRCKPGDLVFYQFDSDSNADHVGIFEKAHSLLPTKFYAVEGNTSNSAISGSQSNGGWIMRKTRDKAKVMAFVSIEFPEDVICPYLEPVTTVYKGIKGNDAGWVQWWLNKKGYYCDIDESFGKTTDTLVRKFQKDNSLTVDGRVGATTRKYLKA